MRRILCHGLSSVLSQMCTVSHSVNIFLSVNLYLDLDSTCIQVDALGLGVTPIRVRSSDSQVFNRFLRSRHSTEWKQCGKEFCRTHEPTIIRHVTCDAGCDLALEEDTRKWVPVRTAAVWALRMNQCHTDARSTGALCSRMINIDWHGAVPVFLSLSLEETLLISFVSLRPRRLAHTRRIATVDALQRRV